VKVQWVRGMTLGFVLAVLGAGEAWAGTTYYAAPAGSGSACTHDVPCSLATALTAPADGAGDVVQLAPGTYSGGALVLDSSDATIQGAPGAGRPVLDATALLIAGAADRVSDLEVDNAFTGSTASALGLVGSGSVAERVVAKATGAGGASGCRIAADGITLRDSVCLATGNQSFALQVSSAGTAAPLTATVRNVVGYASGPNSAGLLGSTMSTGTVTVNATNSIFHSPFLDVDGSGTGGHVTIALATSDYVTTGGLNATVTPAGTAGNFTADPLYVGPGDFHLQASSTLIDHGTDDAANGTLDLDGQPRLQGAHTDIGAYEHAAPPPPPSPGGGGGGGGGGSGSPPPPPPGAKPGTLAVSRTAKVKKGVAQLTLSCKGGPCAGRLTLKLRKSALGAKAYSLGAGRSATLKVKLSKSARRRLAKARHHRLNVTVSVAANGAAARTLSVTLSGQ
jgi:hypothetical protein